MLHELRKILGKVTCLSHRDETLECRLVMKVLTRINLSETEGELDPGVDEIEYIVIDVNLVSTVHNIIIGAMRKKRRKMAELGCREVA